MINTAIDSSLEITEINATFSEAIVIHSVSTPQESRYETTFTEGDLSIAGILIKQHNLGKKPSSIAVFDPNDESIGIQKIEVLTNNAIAIPLNDFLPLKAGNWTLIVGG